MDLAPLILDHSPWLREPEAAVASRWPVRRDLHARILQDLLSPERRRATVVLGPRHVGKSVLLLQLAEDLLRGAPSRGGGWPATNLIYFDFSDDRLLTPVSARQVLDALPVRPDPSLPRVLLFDEVRRVPQWDRWLKRWVDREEDRIVVTDSAASLLREGSRESGTGRWDEHELEGLSLAEFQSITRGRRGDPVLLHREFPRDFDSYLQLGGFPAYHSESSVSEVRRRLREDIATRTLERDLARSADEVDPARRLFVYLVQDSGAIFNASKRARDLETNYKQVGRWVQLFLDAKLLVALPRRALDRRGRKESASKRLGAHPRVYAADHGMIMAFSPLPDPFSDPDVRGQIYESLVFRHLRDLQRSEVIRGLSYYREDGERNEVDFVVDTERGTLAIEVTGAARWERKAKELVERGARLGARRALLIHGGASDEVRAGARALPLVEFLLDPAKALLEE